jgi:hypothetical protein
LFAHVSYPDAPAAIDWLEAIGFHAVTPLVTTAPSRTPSSGLATPSPCWRRTMPTTACPRWLATRPAARSNLLVDDIDAIYAAAIEAGATALLEPETTAWGTGSPPRREVSG